jgi:hypothetical protein
VVRTLLPERSRFDKGIIFVFVALFPTHLRGFFGVCDMRFLSIDVGSRVFLFFLCRHSPLSFSTRASRLFPDLSMSGIFGQGEDATSRKTEILQQNLSNFLQTWKSPRDYRARNPRVNRFQYLPALLTLFWPAIETLLNFEIKRTLVYVLDAAAAFQETLPRDDFILRCREVYQWLFVGHSPPALPAISVSALFVGAEKRVCALGLVTTRSLQSHSSGRMVGNLFSGVLGVDCRVAEQHAYFPRNQQICVRFNVLNVLQLAAWVSFSSLDSALTRDPMLVSYTTDEFVLTRRDKTVYPGLRCRLTICFAVIDDDGQTTSDPHVSGPGCAICISHWRMECTLDNVSLYDLSQLNMLFTVKSPLSHATDAAASPASSSFSASSSASSSRPLVQWQAAPDHAVGDPTGTHLASSDFPSLQSLFGTWDDIVTGGFAAVYREHDAKWNFRSVALDDVLEIQETRNDPNQPPNVPSQPGIWVSRRWLELVGAVDACEICVARQRRLSGTESSEATVPHATNSFLPLVRVSIDLFLQVVLYLVQWRVRCEFQAIQWALLRDIRKRQPTQTCLNSADYDRLLVAWRQPGMHPLVLAHMQRVIGADASQLCALIQLAGTANLTESNAGIPFSAGASEMCNLPVCPLPFSTQAVAFIPVRSGLDRLISQLRDVFGTDHSNRRGWIHPDCMEHPVMKTVVRQSVDVLTRLQLCNSCSFYLVWRPDSPELYERMEPNDEAHLALKKSMKLDPKHRRLHAIVQPALVQAQSRTPMAACNGAGACTCGQCLWYVSLEAHANPRPLVERTQVRGLAMWY